METHTWTLCRYQSEYIATLAERHRLEPSKVVERLIQQANAENKVVKRTMFLAIRCLHCHQSSTGGTKVPCVLHLPDLYTEWLQTVCTRCAHPDRSKTLRILIDFYSSVLESRPALELLLFPPPCNATSSVP
jgi:hypothetical protein